MDSTLSDTKSDTFTNYELRITNYSDPIVHRCTHQRFLSVSYSTDGPIVTGHR
jgi:hypothetical protein